MVKITRKVNKAPVALVFTLEDSEGKELGVIETS